MTTTKSSNTVPTNKAEQSEEAPFSERVRSNQQHLRSNLRSHYDFIVCGSGSSGSVVARRLAENPEVNVLLLEAGGSDEVPQVIEANQWPSNIGSERDWSFQSRPSASLNGRAVHMSMGKVLGGGSSINVMVWARGHKSDWDFFAAEANDPAWNYDSVLKIYRRIEDWQGLPDPDYRGVGGPVFVEPAPDPNPVAPAMLDAARSIGIPTFENQNGRMMEGDGGASIIDIRAKNGKRQSIFRSYVYPLMDRINLTVLSGALVLRLNIESGRATGVDVLLDGAVKRFSATREIVLSLGAIHTPKLLMQSGIGDESELRRHGIPVLQHTPGVGKNFQDHIAFDCIWEYRDPLPPRNTMAEATYFWKSDSAVATPDIQTCLAEVPKTTPENSTLFEVPQHGWTLFGGLMRPKSRGYLSLTGPNPDDPIQIEANFLAHPDDLKSAVACVELCREVGNATPLRPFARREVMPGNLRGAALEDFVRTAATTYWHETCTAKMGTDDMSVVNSRLQVYGIQNLRIADGSIMPRVTTGNTMAPCVIIGERASEVLLKDHRL